MFKLLIVDDEKLIREGLATGLDWASLGFYVSGIASNGLEAIKLIEKDTPDIIITDIKMPIMDGLELIKHVRTQNSNIKFIVLSGYDVFDYAQKAISYGVTSYLLKPISENDLFPLMEKLYIQLKDQENNMETKKTASMLLKRSKIDNLSNELRKLLYNSSYDDNNNNNYIENLFTEVYPEINIQYMKVCLIYCHNLLNSHIVYQQLHKYNENTNIHFLVDGENIVCIFNSVQSEIIVSQILTILEKSNSNIKTSENITITLSQAFSGLSNLKYAYTEASGLLKHRFYSSPDQILLKPSTFIKGSSDIPSILDSVIRPILNGNEIEYKINLREFFEKCHQQYLTKDILVFKLVDGYTSAIKQLINIDLQIDRNQLYLELNSLSNFREFKNYVEDLFNKLFQQLEFHKLNSEQPIIKKVENYINENFGDKITLKSLSQKFHINPSYLSHLFCQKTGVSISNHLQNVRLQNAKKLLVSSDYRIHEIANMVGYKEYRYFCTIFKKEIGKTPMEYRLSSIMQK